MKHPYQQRCFDTLTRNADDGDAESTRPHRTDDISSLQNWNNLDSHDLSINRAPILADTQEESSLDVIHRGSAKHYSSECSPKLDETAVGQRYFNHRISQEIQNSGPEKEIDDCGEVSAHQTFEDCAAYIKSPNNTDPETPSGEWEALRIIGEEMIDGKRHYMMEWKPSLVSEDDAQNAAQLITMWNRRKARIRIGAQKGKQRKRIRRDEQ